jgi:L-methionine (R)-S-oxide reductase
MLTANEIITDLESTVRSSASRNKALEDAVRILKEQRPLYNWVGIYLLDGDVLRLHNYIGKPTEHTEIPVGRGVCGVAVANKEDQNIPDVDKLDNYLACSVETRSEIVVLIRRGKEIFGQIDIDSDTPNAFSAEDEALLRRVADLLARRF